MNGKSKAYGLTCPNCGGVVPVPEGARIVTCPFCDMRSMVQGDRGIRRWQVINRMDRTTVTAAVQGFYSGINKARDLKRQAQLRELFLVYLPYWRVDAFVAGWIFGRVNSGDDSTKPVEEGIMEHMHWMDAATDVSEFGVHRVTFPDHEMEPYDSERLHAEGMVFEPVESMSEALSEAKQHFFHKGRSKRSLKQKFFERFHILRRKFSLVYYPLWVARYEYRNRSYQVVVDGFEGDILYGKAPGNILYRAATLVGGMAAGTFILVNGTILGGIIISASDDGDSLAVLLLPLALGIGLIIAGYRRFRYGEEVESVKKRARKLSLGGRQSGGVFSTGVKILEQVSDLDFSNYE
jgi:hypothetical protein